MNAAFMQFQQHERGIHAVRLPGTLLKREARDDGRYALRAGSRRSWRMSLWPDVVREAGDAVGDCAAVSGPGDAIVKCSKDIRIARYERAEAHREHDGDHQCHDTADDPRDGRS
jgi:hypothetical protein